MIITISGQEVPVRKETLEVNDTIDQHSTCSFVVVDTEGEFDFEKGEPVEVYNDDDKLVFGGVIEEAHKRKVTKGLFRHEIICQDWHYLASKRIAARAYKGQKAGQVINALLDNYLRDEGLYGGYYWNIYEGKTWNEVSENE